MFLIGVLILFGVYKLITPWVVARLEKHIDEPGQADKLWDLSLVLPGVYLLIISWLLDSAADSDGSYFYNLWHNPLIPLVIFGGATLLCMPFLPETLRVIRILLNMSPPPENRTEELETQGEGHPSRDENPPPSQTP